MNQSSKIYVAGDSGLVGSALVRKLSKEGYSNLLVRSHSELDLTCQSSVRKFFDEEKPEYILIAAGKVGGIFANSHYPAEFISQNLLIATNLIHESYLHQAKRLLYFGSSCIYPRDCPQPMREEDLLSGPLEPTNEAYAIAKIAGIKMCHAYNQQYKTNFLAVQPCNLYGSNDQSDLQMSHVIPALLRKFHEAKIAASPTLTLWGSGSAKREFLHVDDLADASFLLMNLSDEKFGKLLTNHSIRFPMINVGYGENITIQELSKIIQEIIGYTGNVLWDETMPDGTPIKLLDNSRMKNLSWSPKIHLIDGLKMVYEERFQKKDSKYSRLPVFPEHTLPSD